MTKHQIPEWTKKLIDKIVYLEKWVTTKDINSPFTQHELGRAVSKVKKEAA